MTLKPKRGLSHLFHLTLVMVLPVLLLLFVKMGLINLAVAVILLAKWRLLAVRPRYWLANLRAGAVDILVGVAVVAFMVRADTFPIQAGWALAYGAWLLLLKPGTSRLKVSLQAATGQALAMAALYGYFGDAPLAWLVTAHGLINYLAARHFFGSFDEPHSPLYAWLWAYTGAVLAWVLGHWLIYYGYLAQPVLLSVLIGFGLASLYYLDHTAGLSRLVRRQLIFIMIAAVAIVLVFSQWSERSL